MFFTDIEYNTERPHLIIPEYGRHIQKMVDQAVAEKDPEKRNKQAKSIISVMGNLNPHLRDVADFQHKLWDQLFIISDFKLDAESPYEKPSVEALRESPASLEYPQNYPKYRFYGNNLKRMIDIAIGWEDGDKKEALVFTIANHMKKCYLNWNKDTVDDTVIFKHLYDLSDGKLDLRETEEPLSESKNLLRKRSSQGQSNSKTNHKKPHHNNQNKNRKRY